MVEGDWPRWRSRPDLATRISPNVISAIDRGRICMGVYGSGSGIVNRGGGIVNRGGGIVNRGGGGRDDESRVSIRRGSIRIANIT